MSEDKAATADRHRKSNGGKHDAPALERVVGALGVVVVLGLLAFLVYQAVAVSDSGAELSATVSQIERVGDQFAAHVRVDNDGGETARGVNVAGELRADGKMIEQATATISYVPPTSFRTSVLVFTDDPREAKLSVRAAGYELP